MKNFITKLKKSWRSKVIQFNTAVAALVIFLPDLQTSFPQLQGYISDSSYRYGMGALIVANIYLRFKTTMSLADKGNKPNV